MADRAVILAINTLLKPLVTVTASSETATMEAANVLDMRPGVPWQAETATDETLTVDHGEDVDIDTVAIIGHNASLDATVRIEIAAADTFADPLYDQVHDVWPPVFGAGEGGAGNWAGGYVDTQELGALVPFRAVRLGAIYTAPHLRLTFNDPSAVDDVVVVGTVMAGIGEVFEANFAHGWAENEVDRSEQRRTDGGGMTIQEVPTWPELRFRLPNLRRSEALTKIKRIKRTNGRKRPVLVMPFPSSSAATFYWSSIYGVFEDYSPTVYPRHDRAEVEFVVTGLI